MSPFLLTSLTLAAALSWAAALAVSPGPWEPVSALLIGIGVILTATVGLVGVTAVGGRWAHLLLFYTLAVTGSVAIARPLDSLWVVGVILSAAALVGLLSPAVTRGIRKLPSATGPPPRAVAPAVLLLATTAVLGLAANGAPPWTVLSVGLSAPLFAFLYSRVVPGGLIGIRFVWPATTLALAPLMGWPPGSLAAIAGVAVVIAAWHPAVKASYHPPVEAGTSFPIPPELAPGEILDAAEIDDSGRPL